MLKPTIKEEGTTNRERYLAKASEKTFFGLWSYPNVYTDEGISKSKTGKELCDLLVVFENKIIIFSDKDILFNLDIDLSISWKRWYKRAVIKSVRQLYGAESWILNHPNRIFLDKACQTKFPFQLNDSKYEIHLVAVTSNTVSVAEKYWGGGSSGTFFHAYSLNSDACMNEPFVIGDLFPNKKYVHVLDEAAFDLLINELTTVSDFISYLEEKERIIRKGEIIQSAGEEELLAHFCRGRSERHTSGEMIHPTGNLDEDGPISLAEGLWDEYAKTENHKIYQKLYEDSLLWDQLIERFSHHIIKATVGRHKEIGFEYHERAVRLLASENRFSRYLLSISFREKFLEVPPDRRSSRLLFAPNEKNKLYIFLFLPRGKNQEYQDYRDERLGHIEAYVLVAKYRYPNAKVIVVIATEPILAEGRSEDIYAAEFDEPLTDSEKQQAERFIREERILSDVSLTRSNPFFDSGNKPYINKLAKYGRNEKCPCGSGKKYKKCCM